MDPVAMAYYALVCALLGALAPSIPNMIARLAFGAVIGLAAAAALPMVRGVIGV